MNLPILIGISFYLVLMLGIGIYASRKVKNLDDFLIAGRQLSFPFATATLLATWFGAGTCMGAAGVAYEEGFLGVVADPIAAGVSLIIAGTFFVHLLRRLNLLTITDIFGIYYGKKAEIFASILMVPVYIGWLGSQMVALGYLINLLIGIPTLVAIIAATMIVLIYTYAGGMWAVTFTDVLQVSILAIGLFFLFPIVLSDIGGFETLFDKTPSSFFRLLPSESTFDSWTSYLGQWALLGLGTVVGQDLIQRSLASKNESIARTSAWTSGVLYITLGCIPVFLGIAALLAPISIEDPELILPTLASHYLSPLFLTLFLGALISAIMSSSDSSLLAASSLITKNIIAPCAPQLSEKQLLFGTRIATLLCGVISMIVALYTKQIYDLMINSWATLFVAILAPVTAALYWKKANKLAAWVSMLSGLTIWIGILIMGGASLENMDDSLFNQAALFGGIASFIAYWGLTLILGSRITDITPAKSLPSEVI